MKRLSVCWTRPTRTPEGPIVSLLAPIEEGALAANAPGPIIRASSCSAAAREAARTVYLNIGAAIGAAKNADGITLREECGGQTWWYHPVAFRDCESDPAFSRLLAIFAALEAAEAHGVEEIDTWGAPAEVVAALRSRLPVTEFDTVPAPFPAWRVARAFAARLAFAISALADRAAARQADAHGTLADVLLMGYWDWSCFPQGGAVADRYFKDTPQRLRSLGLSSGWLCWLDPGGDPGRPKRERQEAARDAAHRGVGLLQYFLRPVDILKSVADFQPLIAYLRRRDDAAFRAVFVNRGIDLHSLFEERLLRGFLDVSIPRSILIEHACAGAAARLKPRAAIHFLEHFPHARAVFAGLRRGAPGLLTAAMQHASFCAEKTFYFLDPALEFRGEPDGRAVPTPDLVFAMGLRPREHFLSCGYPPERVIATGSPRYDHIGAVEPAKSWSGPGVKVLLVPALDLATEAPMLEAARAAAEGLDHVELRLREHPFARPETDARYARARAGLTRSSASLKEDLAWADVVLFTYSTVAEEAVLQGIPACQWLPLGYNASALAEAAAIPGFASIRDLKKYFLSFDKSRGLPNEITRHELLKNLFLSGDGHGAERLASALATRIPTRTVPVLGRDASPTEW